MGTGFQHLPSRNGRQHLVTSSTHSHFRSKERQPWNRWLFASLAALAGLGLVSSCSSNSITDPSPYLTAGGAEENESPPSGPSSSNAGLNEAAAPSSGGEFGKSTVDNGTDNGGVGTGTPEETKPPPEPTIKNPAEANADVRSEPVEGEPNLRKITIGSVSVHVVVDKPSGSSADALVVYNGTVADDANIIPSAEVMIQKTKQILGKRSMLIVSVAYPQQFRHIGDNLPEAEAALLWVKSNASQELGIQIKRVFLLGHSQGAYLVTRMSSLHQTDGIVANAAGPLDFVFRCRIEEDGKIEASEFKYTGRYCQRMKEEFGPTTENPKPYSDRSLLSHLKGFQSEMLFIQGLTDSPIQMKSWGPMKELIQACTNCKKSSILEVEGAGHSALFESPQAAEKAREFLGRLDP